MGGGMTGAKFAQFVFCTLIMALGAGAGIWEFGLLAVVLIFAGGAGIIWAISDSLWDRHNDELIYRRSLVDARTKFTLTIAAADQVTRQFLAQEWPELGVEFGQEALTYVLKNGVNTQVLIPFLQAFLRDSSEHTFVDVRNYNDEKYLQEHMNVSRDIVRRQWKFASEWLLKEGYLRAGSMAGNQTYHWTTTEHYKKMCRFYLNMAIPELGDE